MNSGFYRAFEDRHRGSRELIISRLEVYLPFIEKLKTLYDPCTALDLGCGRGEWLELLQKHGVQAKGVDLDADMLESCQELKLKVEQCDAIKALQRVSDNSLSIISGFHIVEHITFAQVQTLVAEAMRVLQPGGVLILETPNAENLVVGTNNFYLDPTHLRPIPHALLAFVAEHAGFMRNKILRLQETLTLREEEGLSLMQVLSGVSPDYAIVAQKPADEGLMNSFDDVFAPEYGISIDQITERYDWALNKKLENTNRRMEELLYKEKELRDELGRTNERLASDERNTLELQDELRKVELHSSQVETLAEQLRQQMLQTLERAHNEETRAREAESALRESIVQVAKLDARYDAAQSSSHSFAKQTEELFKELLDLNRRCSQLETQLNHEQEQVTNLRQKDLELQARIRKQKEELQRKQTESSQQTEHNQELVESNVNLQQMLERLTAERDVLQGELDKLQQQYDDTSEQLNKSLDNAHHWYLSTTELEVELDTLQQQHGDITEQLDKSLNNAHHWYLSATELEVELEKVRVELHAVHQSNHQHWIQLEERTQQLKERTQQLEYTTLQLNKSLGNVHTLHLRATVAEQRVEDLLSSSSWRITAPLRGLRILIGWLLFLPIRAVKTILRPVFSGMMRYVLRRPVLRQRLLNRLRTRPRLHAHLRQFAIVRGFIDAPVSTTPSVPVTQRSSTERQISLVIENVAHDVKGMAEIDLSGLTPRAREIYTDLQDAIIKNRQAGK